MTKPLVLTRRAVLGGIAGAALLGALPSSASTLASPQGVALGLFASDPEWDYGSLLDEIVALGTHSVLIVVPLYQDDVRATVMQRRPGASPSTATVGRTLAQCRARGLRVALMPLVRLSRRTVTQWRGVLDPIDVGAWFDAWDEVVTAHADLAARHGADRLVIGTEFASLEVHEDRWRALIDRQRRHFSGRLLYSANWDHQHGVAFWDALDEIGVTGYFRLAAEGVRPDSAAIAAMWAPILSDLGDLGRRHDRPVLLTEVGWPALPTAASHPWDDTRGGAPDPVLQTIVWTGFLHALRAHGGPGFYAWNWFGLARPGERGHALRGQPAAEILRAHFRAVLPSGAGSPH